MCLPLWKFPFPPFECEVDRWIFPHQSFLTFQCSVIGMSWLPNMQLCGCYSGLKMTTDACFDSPPPFACRLACGCRDRYVIADVLICQFRLSLEWRAASALVSGDLGHHIEAWLPRDHQPWEDMDRHSGGSSQLCPASFPSVRAPEWAAQPPAESAKWLQSVPCRAGATLDLRSHFTDHTHFTDEGNEVQGR